MTKKHENMTITPTLETKSLLLHAVLKYLEHNGFPKTLKKFLSEANIKDDKWKSISLDLDQIYCKYLKTCSYAGVDTTGNKEVQTSVIKEDNKNSNVAASEEIVVKKKMKSKSVETVNNAATDPSLEAVANDEATQPQRKLEKKKGKKNSVSHIQTEGNIEASQQLAEGAVNKLQIDESIKNKKKKKSDLDSRLLDCNAKQEQLDPLPRLTGERSKDLASSKLDSKYGSEVEAGPADTKKKSKSSTKPLVGDGEQHVLKDKTTNELVPDSPLDTASDVPLGKEKVKSKDKERNKKALDEKSSLKSDTVMESFLKSKKVEGDAEKDSRKRKRSTSEENEDQSVEQVSVEESKRRKTGDRKEAKVVQQLAKTNEMPEDQKHAGNESNVGGEYTNGVLKNGAEKSFQQKSARKQINGSAEPKTVNAFQRVKVEKVVFADERLQDNSYWAMDGAEVGYGAKAQEVLGQVKGRDFRHEKTKKKRGSYRGGQIDMQTRSVKFNYSDED